MKSHLFSINLTANEATTIQATVAPIYGAKWLYSLLASARCRKMSRAITMVRIKNTKNRIGASGLSRND